MITILAQHNHGGDGGRRTVSAWISHYKGKFPSGNPGARTDHQTVLALSPNSTPLPKFVEGVNQYKQDLLRRALEKTGRNQTEAAKLLGVQRTYLARLIKVLGIR